MHRVEGSSDEVILQNVGLSIEQRNAAVCRPPLAPCGLRVICGNHNDKLNCVRTVVGLLLKKASTRMLLLVRLHSMRSLLLAVLAAYLNAAIHSVLAFVNKRRSLQRVAEWSIAVGFVLHTAALIADWAIDGHYPLFFLSETLSFLAWALVAAYGLVLYRYRSQALGVFTMPLVSVLTFVALVIKSRPKRTPHRSRQWYFLFTPRC